MFLFLLDIIYTFCSCFYDFFFFKQKTAYEMRISDWSSDVCSSDLWLTDFKTVATSAARYQNLSLNTLKLAGQCGKLKCCLNYELDSYMDALKDIPNNIERIETLRGMAYLQKTDIFKKLMWFSYPGEENWIPLTTDRVKEIHQLNKEGVKPEEIGEAIGRAHVRTPVTNEKIVCRIQLEQ